MRSKPIEIVALPITCSLLNPSVSVNIPGWQDAVSGLAEFLGRCDLFLPASARPVGNEIRRFVSNITAILEGKEPEERPYELRASTPQLECRKCGKNFVIFSVVKIEDGSNALKEETETEHCPFCGKGDGKDEGPALPPAG